MDYPVETFTDEERAPLAPHFTNLDRPVFALVNLPETVKGALFARYSRYQGTLRRLYLDEFAADAGRAPAVRRRGGRARAQALRAHLHRLRRRLGGPARRRPHRLRVGLERDDEAAPARPAGRLPRAVHALHALRRADGRGARLPLLAPPGARARSTRRRWTSSSTPTREALPRVEAWAAERFPRADGRARGRARALDPRQGARPAARAAAGRLALARGHLRLAARPTSSCCCACSPRRCPRRATTPSMILERAEGGGAELRGARRAPRPRRRVDRLPRASARSAAERWAARLGLDRARRDEQTRAGRAAAVGARASEDGPARGAAVRGGGRVRGRGARGRSRNLPPDERAAMLAELVGERAQPPPPPRPRLRGAPLPLRGGVRLRRLPRPPAPPAAHGPVADARARAGRGRAGRARRGGRGGPLPRRASSARAPSTRASSSWASPELAPYALASATGSATCST